MRFLPILILLIIAVAARRRRGSLDRRAKADFAKRFNITDLEGRRSRLSRLRFRGSQNDTEIAQRRANAKKFLPEKTDEDQHNGTTILDLNDMSGSSDYLYEGDINLTEEQLSVIESNSERGSRKKRQVGTQTTKWTNNVVYYEFDSSLNARKIASAQQAIIDIMSRTCVNFVQSSTAANRVLMYSGSGCSSMVGMVGGVQALSIGTGCEKSGTIAHELMHALGIFHEQSRPDRDSYVTVDLSTVPANLRANFQKLSTSQSAQYTPYEYGSVMQYDATAFSSSGSLTMIPHDNNYIFTLGSRFISFYDYVMINTQYGCNAQCSTNNCKNGGKPNPRNCGTCICPRGFGGALCDQRPTGCGAELTATTSWQTVTATVGDSSAITEKDVYAECNHWIKSPAGTQVQIQITSMYNPQCMYGCPYNGLEMKLDPTNVATGRRMCCSTAMNTVYTASSNFLPLISYNSYYYSTFTIQYKYSGAGPNPGPGQSCPPDTNTNCANWANNGFCTNAFYSDEQRRQYCPTSCNLCN